MQLEFPVPPSLGYHVGMEWEISLTGDFQHNFFGDFTFLVESLVKKNNSGRVLAGHLFPLAPLVSLGATMMGEPTVASRSAHPHTSQSMLGLSDSYIKVLCKILYEGKVLQIRILRGKKLKISDLLQFLYLKELETESHRSEFHNCGTW